MSWRSATHRMIAKCGSFQTEGDFRMNFTAMLGRYSWWNPVKPLSLINREQRYKSGEDLPPDKNVAACAGRKLTSAASIRKFRFLFAGRSSNGRTPDSGSGYRGSSPCLPAKRNQTLTGGPILESPVLCAYSTPAGNGYLIVLFISSRVNGFSSPSSSITIPNGGKSAPEGFFIG